MGRAPFSDATLYADGRAGTCIEQVAVEEKEEEEEKNRASLGSVGVRGGVRS